MYLAVFDNNNNNHDNVYGAVIMLKAALREFTLVHAMSAARQMAADL